MSLCSRVSVVLVSCRWKSQRESLLFCDGFGVASASGVIAVRQQDTSGAWIFSSVIAHAR